MLHTRVTLVLRRSNPDAGLRLGCHGMGAVFTQCKGWPDDAGGAGEAAADRMASPFGGVPASEDGEPVALKLQGTHALVAEVGPRLKELLEAQSIDPGSWQLPVFMCKEMQSAAVVPVFLTPADLAATWKTAGGAEEDLPENLAVMDLRMLVKEMQTCGPRAVRAYDPAALCQPTPSRTAPLAAHCSLSRRPHARIRSPQGLEPMAAVALCQLAGVDQVGAGAGGGEQRVGGVEHVTDAQALALAARLRRGAWHSQWREQGGRGRGTGRWTASSVAGGLDGRL